MLCRIQSGGVLLVDYYYGFVLVVVACLLCFAVTAYDTHRTGTVPYTAVRWWASAIKKKNAVRTRLARVTQCQIGTIDRDTGTVPYWTNIFEFERCLGRTVVIVHESPGGQDLWYHNVR